MSRDYEYITSNRLHVSRAWSRDYEYITSSRLHLPRAGSRAAKSELQWTTVLAEKARFKLQDRICRQWMEHGWSRAGSREELFTRLVKPCRGHYRGVMQVLFLPISATQNCRQINRKTIWAAVRARVFPEQ